MATWRPNDFGLFNIFRPRGGLGGMGGGRGPRAPGGWGGGGRWPGGGGGRGGWPGGGGGGGRGPSPVSGPDQDLDPTPLKQLAEDTGGRCEILKNLEHEHGKDRLKEAVESIAVTLRHRYLVGYEPQGQAGKSGWRNIKVNVDRPSVTVQARKGYYAES